MAHSYTAHTADYPDSVSWLNPGGDDYEERMRLENTVQVPDISLSSQASDVEYPRRMPDAQLHTMDSGIYPFDDDNDNDGITLSTIAHHISGITLSPGFASRATPTMSDYDVSRPVANIDLRQAKANLSTFTYPRPSLSTALKDKKFSPKRPAKSQRPEKENEPPATPQSRTPRKRNQAQSTSRNVLRLPDITGITVGASSPGKPISPSHSDPPSQRHVLEALTRQLETVTREAEFAKGKVLQLEVELENRRHTEQELTREYRWSPNSHDRAALLEVTREKQALEALVMSLRSHQDRLEKALQDRSFELAQCRAEILHQQETISELRSRLSRAKEEVWSQANEERALEIQRLRDEIARLERECVFLRGCVEKGLASIRDSRQADPNAEEIPPVATAPNRQPAYMVPLPEPATSRLGGGLRAEPAPVSPLGPAVSQADATAGDRSIRERGTPWIQENEISRVQFEISERRSERSASVVNSPVRPTSPPIDTRSRTPAPQPTSSASNPRPSTKDTPRRREKSRESHSPPFPQIRGEHMERLFFSAAPHDEQTCSTCHRKKSPGRGTPTWLRAMGKEKKTKGRVHHRESEDKQNAEVDNPPPQTVLTKVLRELEDDFSHYKSIYCELADQYKLMDGTSNVAKRNVLAEHLTEVIRVLERKGDQIAGLYELLTYQDKPLDQPNARPTRAS